jgi:broad specificity phosphatase PhoE
MVAIEGLRERYPEHEVVVVSHGGVMLSMWAHLVGRWKDAHLPPNCGIVIVEHDRDRFYPPKIVEP